MRHSAASKLQPRYPETAIQVLENTEITENETVLPGFPVHPEGGSKFGDSRLFYLCDLSVLCG
jgi:hypothetical protein